MAYADGEPVQKSPAQQHSGPPPHDKCGMACAADLIGDRWTLLILREALYGVTRFDAMHANLGAPRTILSGRLKKLCAAEVMTKRRYQVAGQRARHQYVLTSKGVELALPMIALMQWGDKHVRDDAPIAEIVERSDGGKLHIGLVNEHNQPVALPKAQLRAKQ